MMSLTAFADELEREKARQRTYDAMARKARAGHVTGGRVFGYDNVEIVDAAGARSHVERRINEPEAAVVRRIFELCAAGTGYTRITKLLNAERSPSPRPQHGRPAGWTPSTVNEMLHRSLYRGEVTWNKTRKRNRWGQQNQQPRASSEWVHVDAQHLRIVPEPLWQAVQARLTALSRQPPTLSTGAKGHRRDVESRFLLSGFARCALCGASFYPMTRSHGRDERVSFYGCSAYHKRGTSVCGNGLQMRADRIDEAVLRTLAGDVLRPAVVMAVVDGALDALKVDTRHEDAQAARVELQRVDTETRRLADSIAAGGEMGALVDALKQRQARKDELTRQLAASDPPRVKSSSRREIARAVTEALHDWRGLLSRYPDQRRQFLRESLVGPLRFTPEGRSYRFEGEIAVGQLLAGKADVAPFVASPTGSGERCIVQFSGVAA
jgi:site-specific DNA recombinase